MANCVVKVNGKRTIGGKFNSIGSAEEQAANTALVVRLCGEVGVDGYRLLSSLDRLFIDDVRYKLNTGGSSGRMFGWKQVERMVEIHRLVTEARKGAANGTTPGK